MSEPLLISDEWRELDELRARASRKLDDQARRARRFQTYYDNEAGIVAMLDTEERQVFKSLLAEASANWCELVVSAVCERMRVIGFRVGTEEDNELAMSIWQANGMDADSELVQTDALVTGQSFVLVQPDERNASGVSMTIESPEQATVLYEPGNRRRRIAGYKRWSDAEHYRTTDVLILPDEIVTWRPGARGPEIERNPAGVVGLVEVAPQPRTLRPPRSELESAVPIQDRINTTIWNRLVATDYGAFRQVFATGVKMRRTTTTTPEGETVKMTPPFEVGANRLLISENPESRFGAIAESTLEGYLRAVEQDVTQLAAITQTPPHYLLGKVVNLAADAIKAAEAGLVAKTGRRATHVGEAYEEAMRIALTLVGSPAAANQSSEVVWADFETRSTGQLTDSLVKMRSLGVPLQVLWERYGATPQEVERWVELRAAEVAAGLATGLHDVPAPPPPAPAEIEP